MSRERSISYIEKIVAISAENIAFAGGKDVPERDDWDIAALSHRAFDKVSENPSIDRLCDSLRRIGNHLAEADLNSDLGKQVEARVANLRWHHADALRLSRTGRYYDVWWKSCIATFGSVRRRLGG
jgi:hypothetical protein